MHWVTSVSRLFIQQFKTLADIDLSHDNLAIVVGSRVKEGCYFISLHVAVKHPDCVVRDLTRLKGSLKKVWEGLGYDANAF